MSEGWNTIDSDAGVFTELVEKLQVPNVELDDIFSIDSDSLLQFAPLHGVIFLFKYGNIDRQYASDGNKPLAGTYDKDYQEKGIFFAKQTIQNACATQAVLNLLMNSNIDLGPELSNFKSFVTGFDSEMAGDTISNSTLIRSVHNSFSAPPMIENDKRPPRHHYYDHDDGLFHFIGYQNINGTLYELDGLKSYPIEHGPCTADTFPQAVSEVIMRRVAMYSGELRFSLLAITHNRLEYFKQIGDAEAMSQELVKREQWARENKLRRQNYTGLIGALVSSLSSHCSESEWTQILKHAEQKGALRMVQAYKSIRR